MHSQSQLTHLMLSCTTNVETPELKGLGFNRCPALNNHQIFYRSLHGILALSREKHGDRAWIWIKLWSSSEFNKPSGWDVAQGEEKEIPQVMFNIYPLQALRVVEVLCPRQILRMLHLREHRQNSPDFFRFHETISCRQHAMESKSVETKTKMDDEAACAVIIQLKLSFTRPMFWAFADLKAGLVPRT